MLSRFVLWSAGIYLFLLAMIVAYGKLFYGFLHGVFPNQSITNPPGAAQQYAAYGQFLDVSIIVLALFLGIWTALWGLVKKNYLLGIGVLIAGVAVTTLAYSVLPRMYLPGIDFLPWGLWIAEGFYAYTGAWLITTVIGKVYRKRNRPAT